MTKPSPAARPQAAGGISMIALIRQGGEMAGGANGNDVQLAHYRDNGRQYRNNSSHSIVDPTGEGPTPSKP